MERTHWTEVGDNLSSFRRNSVWRDHADSVNRALIARWLPGAGSKWVLKTDAFEEAVGAGVCSLLSERSSAVAIVDWSLTTLGHTLHAGLRVAPVCGDVRRLPIGDATLDAVVSFSTLDHFRSMNEVLASLREMHRSLIPGGRLLITMDNLANPLIWLRNHVPSALLRRSGIVPYYVGASCGPSGFSRLLGQAGFQVVERRLILHCPRVAAVPLCALLSARRAAFLRPRFRRLLLAFERLGELPTAPWTGHYVAALAVKPLP